MSDRWGAQIAFAFVSSPPDAGETCLGLHVVGLNFLGLNSNSIRTFTKRTGSGTNLPYVLAQPVLAQPVDASLLTLMAKVLDPLKLSSPHVFLIRMLAFIIVVGAIAAFLQKQIVVAFMSNPGLNGLIVFVEAIGIALALRQVLRLYPEIAWVNNVRRGGDPGRVARRPPVLLAPMVAILSRIGPMAMSAQLMRGLLDSIATRLDEARDISRYMTGLLVFLGLLGTFWGLIATVSSVGEVIQQLRPGGDAASIFDSLRNGLAAPLSGMGISFSSSLFGLAGSLVLGFLDLQSSQAQNRFYTELEDWLSTTVYDHAAEPALAAGATGELNAAIERLRGAVDQAGAGKTAAAAMANLAEAIQVLVHHMRTEQSTIREWVDGQAEQQREIRKLLEIMLEEKVNS